MEFVVSNEGSRMSNTSRANIRKAQAAIQRMKLLTDDINHYLALYDVQTKRLNADPNQLLQSVLSQMNGKIEKVGAEIQSAKLPSLTIDPYLFQLLLTQLLDNAIKFREPSTTPVIKIAYGGKDHIHAPGNASNGKIYDIISISDNGIGFDKKDQEKIFELFYAVHDKSKYKGSGIGLAICNKIMAMHGGFIKATANPGKGAMLQCYFPVEK
jgi:signal transduction histidine kinase